MPAFVAQILRYPVKGLSPQPMERAGLTAGEGLPGDRRFAIAHGASSFDPRHPSWQPKRQFLELARNPRLAALQTAFDEAAGLLTIRRDGKRVARGNIATPLGRELINQFFAAYMGPEALGAPKLVEAPGVAFTDSRAPCISILGLASCRDIERVARRPVDPVRFRANLLLDGLEPWAEFTWLNREIRIGAARLRVVARISRCAATEVSPGTGERDLNIPRILQAGFGHTECGVYAEVTADGAVAVGDAAVPL